MKIKNQNCAITFLLLFLLFTISYLLPVISFASEKWPGVDETVVEKYAEEHGRIARPPLINTGQGDLLLFVFLLAGAVGGFAAGYCWRSLLERKPKDNNAPIR